MHACCHQSVLLHAHVDVCHGVEEVRLAMSTVKRHFCRATSTRRSRGEAFVCVCFSAAASKVVVTEQSKAKLAVPCHHSSHQQLVCMLGWATTVRSHLGNELICSGEVAFAVATRVHATFEVLEEEPAHSPCRSQRQRRGLKTIHRRVCIRSINGCVGSDCLVMGLLMCLSSSVYTF